MPEVGFKDSVVEVADVMRNSRYILSTEQVVKMMKDFESKGDFDLELVGDGAECVVLAGRDGVSSSGETDLVAAITYRDRPPEIMKKIFYRQRIMSTLFPHNFPRFVAAFGKHPSKNVSRNVSGTIRERIKVIGDYDDQKAKFPFSVVEETVENLRLPFGFDTNDFNLGMGVDGGSYCLDKVGGNNDEWDDESKERVIRYMSEHGYTEREKYVVGKSVDRLIALEKESTEE